MPYTFDSDRMLDETGWKILTELQNNARISLAELGRKVGLTPPAVADRVRKFEEAGIITGYHAKVSLEKIGYPILAYIRYTNTSQSYPDADVFIRSICEVLECYRVTGTDSYIIKIAATSMAHLAQIINQLSPFGSVVTSLALSAVREHQTVAAPPENN